MIPLFRLVLPVLEATPQRWIQLTSMLPPELIQWLRPLETVFFGPYRPARAAGRSVT
jgi:hypothetical protein